MRKQGITHLNPEHVASAMNRMACSADHAREYVSGYQASLKGQSKPLNSSRWFWLAGWHDCQIDKNIMLNL